MHFEFDAEFWVFIGFLTFIGGLAYLKVHKKILSALDARGARIKKEINEAETLRAEAMALLASFERKKADAE